MYLNVYQVVTRRCVLIVHCSGAESQAYDTAV